MSRSGSVAWWKKGLAVLMSWAMLATSTPVPALAEAEEPTGEVVEEVQDTEDVTDPEQGNEEVDDQTVIDTDDELTDEVAEPEVTVPVTDEVIEEQEEAVEDEAEAEETAEDVELETMAARKGTLYLNGAWSNEVTVAGTDWSQWDTADLTTSADVNPDIWTFSLSSTQYVSLSVKDVSGKLVWWLEDSNGRITDHFTRTSVGISTYGASLPAGKYYLVVCSYNPSTLTYSVMGKTSYSQTAIRSVELTKKTYTYTGAAIAPTVVVKDAYGNTLVRNVDYKVTGSKNVSNAAKMTVQGIGLYSGSKTMTFKIVKRKINSGVKAAVPVKYYTGKAIKPNPTVKIGGVTLKKGTDYTIVKYSNNKKAGTASVTIKGKGGLYGTRTIKFKIRYNISKNGAVRGTYRRGTTTFTKFTFVKTKATMKKTRDYKLTVYQNTSTKKVYKMVGKGLYAGTTYFTLYK